MPDGGGFRTDAVILAIEGGGSRTRGWLATGAPTSPQVLAERVMGPSNHHTIGAPALAAVLGQLTTALVEADPGRRVRPHAIALGLAGVDSPADRQMVREAIGERRWGVPVVVTNDARMALEGATGGNGGVIVISGTGSIAMGVDRNGNEARSGGWGHALGDEGSGYALGRALLRHATRVLDHRRKATPLFDALLEHLGLADHRALVEWIRARSAQPNVVADLSRLVTSRSAAGDEVASRMVERAAHDLARLVSGVRRTLHLRRKDLSIVLYGGLLINDAHFREVATHHLETYFQDARIATGRPDDALRGCMLLAHRQLTGEEHG